jgi:hypothetical protein
MVVAEAIDVLCGAILLELGLRGATNWNGESMDGLLST